VLTEILVPLGLFLLVGFIVWLQARRGGQRVAAQLELSSKAIERLASAEDLARFLETDAGSRLFQLAAAGQHGVERAILRSIQAGIVLLFLGLAFLVLTVVVEEMIISGVICVALGGGLICSGAVARLLQGGTSC